MLSFTDYSDAIVGDGLSFRDLFDYITGYSKSHGWKSFELRADNQPSLHLAPNG
jgi:hypothetical protein